MFLKIGKSYKTNIPIVLFYYSHVGARSWTEETKDIIFLVLNSRPAFGINLEKENEYKILWNNKIYYFAFSEQMIDWLLVTKNFEEIA